MNFLEDLELKANLAALPVDFLAALVARAEWRLQLSRANQRPPVDQATWDVWLLQAGRGFGKTRSAVEWLWWEAWNDPDSFNHVVTRTASDLEKVAFDGPSGLFRKVPAEIVADKTKSPFRMVLKNGARILSFSADEPDQLRGPECHRVWCDELATWRRLDATWNDGVVFGTRLGSARNAHRPKKVITTTPRPLKFLKDIVKAPGTIVSRGSTYDNKANLAASVLAEFERLYKGTRRGKQELLGELLEDIPGALWLPQWIENARLWEAPDDMTQLVVAVDPATSANENSNETGIVAVGRNRLGRGFVLADRTDVYSPKQWGEAAVLLYDELKADHITVETNQGGDMCREVLEEAANRLCQEGKRKGRAIPIRMVHASRGKEIRAEPVSQMYEQGRISHVGEFVQLEEQMLNFTKGFDRKNNGSPDRLDALVWGFTDILVDGNPSLSGVGFGSKSPSRWTGARLALSMGR